MKKILFSLLWAVASVALFTACDKEKEEEKNEKQLVGSWELNSIAWTEEDGYSDSEYFDADESVWTFHADGTFTLADDDGEGEISYETGKWSLTGDLLVLIHDYEEGVMTLTVQKLTDRKLELRFEEEGEVEVYHFTRK